MTEVKTELDNYDVGGYIVIPYEINHDFFMKAQSKLQESLVNTKNIKIVGPDYGAGWILEGEEKDNYIASCEFFENNLDMIMESTSLPARIGEVDDYYIEFSSKEITKD